VVRLGEIKDGDALSWSAEADRKPVGNCGNDNLKVNVEKIGRKREEKKKTERSRFSETLVGI